jgi:hypothetical protein
MRGVRSFLRIIFNDAMWFSLILCVAAALLWARSERVQDLVLIRPKDAPYMQYACNAYAGRLSLFVTESETPMPGPTIEHAATEMKPEDASAFRDLEDDYTWHGFVWHRGKPGDMPSGEPPLRCFVCVPFWAVALIAGVLPGAWFYRRLTRVRHLPGRCRACGYDLRATPDRCPECGTVPAVTTDAPARSPAART